MNVVSRQEYDMHSLEASFLNKCRSEGMTPVRVDVCDTFFFLSYYWYEQLGSTT